MDFHLEKEDTIPLVIAEEETQQQFLDPGTTWRKCGYLGLLNLYHADCTDNQVKYLKVFPAEKPVQCPDEHLECIKLC